MIRRVGIFFSGAATSLLCQRIYSSEFQTQTSNDSPILLADIKETSAAPIPDRLRRDVISSLQNDPVESTRNVSQRFNGANFIADAVEVVLA
jgi:hypothetical protein